MNETGSMRIRPTTHRGQGGYLVCGTDRQGRRVSVFTITRRSAEEIRRKIRAGTGISQADFML